MFSKLAKFTPKTISSVFARNIAVGQKIPDASLTVLEFKNGAFEKTTANAQALFGTGTNILVGFPGAFTPACTKTHIPEYLDKAKEVKEGGAKKVYALAVNDPFVLQAFAEKLGGNENVSFIADPNGEFIKKLDVTTDLSAAGLGIRSRRFSLVAKDGEVVQFNDEKGPGMTDLSRVANILTQLKAAKK